MNFYIPKLSFGFLILITLISCGVNNSSEADNLSTQNTTRQDFENAYAKFLNYENTDKTNSNIIKPEFFLNSINPWFSSKKTMEYVSLGTFDGYIIKNLPKKLTDQLLESAYQDNEKTGFILLQSSFWRKVSALQKEGFRIGFLNSASKQTIAGVYFSGRKTILLSLTAPEGTLDHELRHHTQYELQQILTNEPENDHYVLSESCIDDLSEYFNELDATTIELKNWIGVFEQYNTDYTNHKPISINATSTAYFTKCLDYPRSKAVELKSRTSCPKELINQVANITKHINKFNSEVSDNISEIIIASSRSKLLYESERNDQYEEDYSEYQSDALKAKTAINSLVLNESTERREKFKNEIPVWFKEHHDELCNRIASYQLITSCRGENE